MTPPFVFRSVYEWAMRRAGLIVTAAQQEHFARRDFDIDELPIPSHATKASTVPRDPSRLTHIICHVTAVRGGFGLARAAHERWRRLLDLDILSLPRGLFDQLCATGDIVEWDDITDGRIAQVDSLNAENLDRLARRLGLWERYRSTPYHEIASQTGDCVANRRLTQRSYHAGDLNSFSAGFALDCAPKEPLSSDMVATGRHGLLCLAHRMVEKGARTPIKVAPHRAGSSGRLKDTARIAWLAVIKPTCQDHPELLEIDYELRVGSGLPVPRSWDPDALYDDRGRRLA